MLWSGKASGRGSVADPIVMTISPRLCYTLFMSAIGTLFLTAAATVGAVAAAKEIKRRVNRARDLASKAKGEGAVLDLEVDQTSGVWRVSDQKR